jgi:hypothetical protein
LTAEPFFARIRFLRVEEAKALRARLFNREGRDGNVPASLIGKEK